MALPSRRVAAPVLACIALASATAWAQSPPTVQAVEAIREGGARLKIAFITCAVDQAFFVPVKKGMHDAARMLDVDCDFIGTPGVDASAQAAMVRQAVADGYNGIALNIIDPEAFDRVVADAIAAGVPVVAFNIDDFSTPNPRLAAVSQRFFEAGRVVAQRALRDIPSGAHVLLTLHDNGVSALDERQRGEQEALRTKNVSWTTVVTGNDSEQGVEVIAKALRDHPDIRVVLGSGQADTEAAGRAIAAYFSGQGFWAAGFDLSPKTLELIKEGHIRFTVDQQPYTQGFYPVVQLVLKLRYGIEPADIDAGAGVIDRSNVDQVKKLSADGYR
jgi:simple sugar transport system substrate-binding protein